MILSVLGRDFWLELRTFFSESKDFISFSDFLVKVVDFYVRCIFLGASFFVLLLGND